MQNSSELPDKAAVQQAMRIANSPAGEKLLALLRSRSDTDLQSAADAAASGNYEQAKCILSKLLSDPDAQTLLEHLGR